MASNYTNSRSVHNLGLFIHHQEVASSLLIFLNCTDHMPTHFDIMQISQSNLIPHFPTETEI